MVYQNKPERNTTMSHPDEIDALLGIESAYAETVQRHYHERIAGFALAERIRELTDPNDPGEHIIDRMRLALAEYEHLSHGFTWAMGDKELPQCVCQEHTLPMWRGRCIGCGVFIWTNAARSKRTELDPDWRR